MDEDDVWLRQPWEDADPPPRQTSGRRATGTEALLIPLARAQDAVARLEASVAAAPDERRRRAARPAGAVRGGRLPGALRPRRASARPGAPRRPSHRLLHAGRADRAAPGSGPVDDSRRRGRGGRRRSSVADALAYARHWRRLAELATLAAAPVRRHAGGAARAVRRPARRRRSDARLARRVAGPAGGRACSPPPGSWRPGCRGCHGATVSSSPRPTSPPRSGAGTATAGPARCRSGRRRCRGSRRWRGTGEGSSSLAISTASPRRQCAGRASSIGCSPPRAGSPNCRGAPAHGCLRPRRRLAGAAGHRTPARPSARCFDARRSGGRSPSLEEGSLTGKGRSRARSTSAAGKIGFRWPVGHPDAKSSRKIVAPWQLEPDCCIASL